MKEIDKRLLFEAEACKKAATKNCSKPGTPTRTAGGPCFDKASVTNNSQINSANKSIADINEDALSREAEFADGAK